MKTSTRRSNRGQGMTEYILIVCLMAIASIAVVTVFGDHVRGLFAMSADALAGDSEVAQVNRSGHSKNLKLTKRTMREFAWNESPY